MGKRTIYVRDEDEALWDRAKELSGEESLSSIIAEALKKLISEKEDPSMENIVVEEWDGGKPFKKSFWGKWLVKENITLHGKWSVALTRNNRFAIYRHPNQIPPYESKLYVVDHLDEADSDLIPPTVLKAVSDNLPEDFVQRLDI